MLLSIVYVVSSKKRKAVEFCRTIAAVDGNIQADGE